ncbi:hypothetical protein [Nitratireductor sp. GCM10026969]
MGLARGSFAAIFKALNEDADFERLDATVIRAHQHAADARRKKGNVKS